jgi:hypothetical protein
MHSGQAERSAIDLGTVFRSFRKKKKVPEAGWTEALDFSLAVLGFELGFTFARQVLYLLSHFTSPGCKTQGLHLEPLHQPFFVMGCFVIGSCQLFAWAGLEP